MSNLKDIAIALAVTATIADAAKEHKDYLRDQLANALDETGAEATRAELDGEKIAKVSMVSPSAKPYVSDERAWLKYVEENHPTEIVQAVRDSFWTAISKDFELTESGQVINSKTGELVEGVSFRSSNSYVSTRFEKDGRERILEALRNGKLALDLTAPKQLTEGTDK